jgi:hypothetical protein
MEIKLFLIDPWFAVKEPGEQRPDISGQMSEGRGVLSGWVLRFNYKSFQNFERLSA